VPKAKLTLKGCKAWIITDGKAGMEVQVAGVAQALEADFEIKRVHPRRLWRLLAPWGPIDRRERFGQEGSQFAPPWPDIALATGRLSIPALRAVRKASPSTYTVIIQDPRTGAGSADLIAVPAHDALRGENVIHTLTAPHGFSQKRLALLRAKPPGDITALPAPTVAVVLGGPNTIYPFTPEDSARLGGALAAMASLSASFLITASRRTPPHLLDAVLEATRSSRRIVWDGKGANPYETWLAHADMFVVTADSINMTGEACASGKPVYVFEPKGGSAKFNRFHESLRRYGATRKLPETFSRLETWAYAPLDSALQIAAEIKRRWRT
jgi:mitochondrial fission protein ELM1